MSSTFSMSTAYIHSIYVLCPAVSSKLTINLPKRNQWHPTAQPAFTCSKLITNTRTRCEICSNLTIKIPERSQWRCSGVFIVNFEHISHLVLLLTLNIPNKLSIGSFIVNPFQANVPFCIPFLKTLTHFSPMSHFYTP